MGANPSMTRPPGANKSPLPVKKPTLAAVLIVKNEADNLRACLASLEGLADEIVILDSGSQDDTPAIAAEFGARFFVNTTWPGFGRQRRLAQTHVQSEWVLWSVCVRWRCRRGQGLSAWYGSGSPSRCGC